MVNANHEASGSTLDDDMLLEFRVSNFRSFSGEQVFSMVASPDDSLEHTNVATVGKNRVLKAAAVFGANASGKSNLVLALRSASVLVANSASHMNLGDEIDVVPFALSAVERELPTRFGFSLTIDNVRFEYEFEVTRTRVVGEWIVAYPNGKAQRWLEREYVQEADTYEWKFRGPLAKEGVGLRKRTRANGLALSRAAERNIDAVAPLYLWFKTGLRGIDATKRSESMEGYSLDLFSKNDMFRRFLKGLVVDADMGIGKLGVLALQGDVADIKFPQNTPDEIKKMARSQLQQGPLMAWILRHVNRDTGETTNFYVPDEAAGTQQLLILGGPLWDCLQNGYTLVVDELDCSLHPHLIRKVVELFQSSRFNESDAQLIFTTHDSTLMDPALLRRDQLWLVEKEPSGASSMYSLYDFEDKKPRKDEALQRGYLGGRYGGVPVFGPTLEDVGS